MRNAGQTQGTVVTITLDLRPALPPSSRHRVSGLSGLSPSSSGPSVTYETMHGARKVAIPPEKLSVQPSFITSGGGSGTSLPSFRPIVDSDENGEFWIEWAEPPASFSTGDLKQPKKGKEGDIDGDQQLMTAQSAMRKVSLVNTGGSKAKTEGTFQVPFARTAVSVSCVGAPYCVLFQRLCAVYAK